MKVYNCFGQDISNIRIRLNSDQYGYVDENNIPHINWGEETDKVDRDGFDKEYRPIKDAGEYLISDYILPKGSIVCRYGHSGGIFTTVKGSEYESLGLPYKKETIEYHEYKVSEDLKVDCLVTKGIVAPKFDSNGGGIQFKHRQRIALECEDGFLQEEISWRQKNI